MQAAKAKYDASRPVPQAAPPRAQPRRPVSAPPPPAVAYTGGKMKVTSPPPTHEMSQWSPEEQAAALQRARAQPSLLSIR